MEVKLKELEDLYNFRDIKQKELNDINIEIKRTLDELQTICKHQQINKQRDYDGHTWITYYFCNVCKKDINNINPYI